MTDWFKDSPSPPLLLAVQSENIAFASRLLELNLGFCNLSHGGMDFVPPIVVEWCRKGVMKDLNLNYNNLANIPLELSSIKHCSLEENPLSSLPRELRCEKWPKIRKYLEVLQDRAITWNYRKVILLGNPASGKSSLVRLFGAKPTDLKSLEKSKIDSFDLKLKSGTKESITFKLWDLNQSVVENLTHQLLLTRGAICIVAFDLRQYKKNSLEYWLKSIKGSLDNSCAIMVVGTHSDLVSEDELASIAEDIQKNFPKLRYPAFSEPLIAVSCKTGFNAKKLKEVLIRLAISPSIRFTASDQSWIQMDELIRSKSIAGVKHVKQDVFKEWLSDCRIPLTDLELVTGFLIRAGNLSYFPNLYDPILGQSHQLYVLRPSWILDTMNTLISAKNTAVICGYASLKDFQGFYSAEECSVVTALLVKYDVIYYNRTQNSILVPFMLSPNSDTELQQRLFPTRLPSGQACVGRIFSFQQLPLHFFGRLMLSVIRLSGVNDLLSWQNGLLISAHLVTSNGESDLATQVHILFLFTEDYELSICMHFAVEDATFAVSQWRRIIACLQTVIECRYPRLLEITTVTVCCPHCLARGRHPQEAFGFSSEQCIDTVLNEKPSLLFCQGIRSAGRQSTLANAAPDLALADLPHIMANHLKYDGELGRGAFGIVYRALLGPSQAPVAVKELNFSKADSFTCNQLFQDLQMECYAMSKLEHKNLVRFHGICHKPLGIVLELLSAGDLFQFMHTTTEGSLQSIPQEDFPWELRLRMARDIAEGLHYLQTRSPPIIHRDLRSPNIFLRDDRSAVIGDFGLAREVHESVEGILATWQWLAPECIDSNGGSYDCTSDIYSLGMIMWEMAAIRLPFNEFTSNPQFFNETLDTFRLLEIKRAIVEDHLRPTIPKETPEHFSNLIRQCWSANPSDRPTTSEIIERLEKMGAPSTLDVAIDAAIQESIFYSELDFSETAPKALAKSEVSQDADCGEFSVACLVSVTADIWVGTNSGQIRNYRLSEECKEITLRKNWQAHPRRICSLLTVGDYVWSFGEDGIVNIWERDTFSLFRQITLTTAERGAMLLSSHQHVWITSSIEGRIHIVDPKVSNNRSMLD